MNEPFRPNEPLPPGVARRIDPVCDRFESAWLAGNRPRIEDFLEQVGETDRPALLRQLLTLDLEYRARAGEAPTAEEYRLRLPDHVGLINAIFAAHLPGPEMTAAHGLGGRAVLPEGAGAWPTVPGYDIVAELGRGGMGVVYQARQVGLNRAVALKMILAGGHAGTAELARFKTEAESLARLQHPNIVQVYEVSECQGRPFFALELCAGGSLERNLAGKPLPPEKAAELVELLAGAMHAAHQAQVIHRDLKPANVLLSSDGTAKITDFGLAKKLDEAGQTQTGAIMGTPSYMAPEQALGKKDVGPPADIYALGAILYECLTGRPPFKAATSFDTVLQVVSEEPVPPRQLNAKIPGDLETICLKCLHKEPARRYPRAADLAEDLCRFRAGEPIAARPVGRIERAWRWCRRNPRLASATAVAVVGLMLTTILALVMALDARQRLWQSRLEQARVERQAGNRWRALELIAEAAKTRTNDKLRQEAIQAITSSGIRLAKEVPADYTDFAHRLHLVVARLEEFGFAPHGNWDRHGGFTMKNDPRNFREKGNFVYTDGDLNRGDGGPEEQLAVYAGSKAGHGPEVFVLQTRQIGAIQLSAKVVSTLPAQFGLPQAFRLSANGDWLAFRDSVDVDMIRLWDCRRHRLHGRLDGRGEVAMLAPVSQTPAEYSPDNVLLASTHWLAEQPMLQIGEITSCRTVTTVPGVVADLWSVDGRYLLTSGSSILGKKAEKLPGLQVRSIGLKGRAQHLHFSQAWEVACPVPTYRIREEIERLTFRTDGKQLAVNGTVWDFLPGKARPVLRQTTIESPGAVLGFSGTEVWAAQLSRFKAGQDKERGGQTPVSLHAEFAAVQVIAGAESLGRQGVLAALPAIMARLHSIKWRNLHVARLFPSGSVMPLTPSPLESVPGGRFDDKPAPSRLFMLRMAEPYSWAWSSDGKKLLASVAASSHEVLGDRTSVTSYSGDAVGDLVMWERETGSSLPLVLRSRKDIDSQFTRDTGNLVFRSPGFSERFLHPYDFAFDFTGRRFVTLDELGLQVWDTSRGTVIRTLPSETFPRETFQKVVWSQDGRSLLAVGTPPATFRTYGAQNSSPRAVVFETEGGEVRSWPAPLEDWTAFTLSVDGRWVITGGEDHLLRIRDVGTGKELARWQAHDATITALTFSPDGQFLVSGGRDGTLRVWDLPWIRGELGKLGLDW